MKKVGDKPEYLYPEELDRIENVVAGDLFFTTLYRVLRYSGRRIGEIVGTPRKKGSKTILTGGIRKKDIDFDKKIMKTIILKTKKRKLQLECPSCNNKANYKNKFCPSCETACMPRVAALVSERMGSSEMSKMKINKMCL